MIENLGTERIVEMLLAGTPDRIIDGLAVMPDDAAEVAALKQALVALAETQAVKPPASLRERVLAAKAKPIRPKKPVLLVLDMIRDYLEPGGPLEVPRARGIVPSLRRRLDEARASGVPVIYVCDRHEADDPDLDIWGAHALAGSEGAEVWPEIAPQPNDIVVAKRTYSAFTGTTLDTVLDDLGADQIILTGCATEIGIAATAKDALERGFAVTIPPDTQAGGSMAGEMVTLISLSAMPPFEPRYLRNARSAAAR